MESSLVILNQHITPNRRYKIIKSSNLKMLSKASNNKLQILEKIIISIFFIALLIIQYITENSIKYIYSFTRVIFNKIYLDDLKDLTLKVIYLNYSFSLKYKVVDIKYCINFYDQYNNSIIPSKFTLYNFHVICHMKNRINNYIFESIANIYINKYFCCNKYFNIGEKLKFGIKVYNTKSLYNKRYIDLKFLFSETILNFRDISHINNNQFDPLLINGGFNVLENKISSLNNSYQDEIKENVSLKKSYITRPICSPMTVLNILNNNWTFLNIYNQYFCFCKGESCFSENNLRQGKICKFNFYLNVIDNNRYLYNKTDYLLGDFFNKKFSSDDAYPIFKEMLKRNISAHYLTQKRDIYNQYCGSNNNHCQIIINEIVIDGDFIEKYMELILRLKATIAGSVFLGIDLLFYKIEYITSINLGHGVKYFKSFLYREYTSPNKYNKLVLVPSKKIIAVALKYGWKEENIIKVCLPKWDKYNNYRNKDKTNGQSIFVFFTWRNLRNEKNISYEYINNTLKIINNDILIKKLKEKNIILNYCLHHEFSHYKEMLEIQNLKLNYITEQQISDTLMKSNLLITDFSSVIFDFIYQKKPIIIYIPDSEDPNIKDKYDNDYFDLINTIKNGTIHLENKYNTTEQVINKIIYEKYK